MDDSYETALSPAILRGLGDRSYDKRKSSALEVTALTKSLIESQEYDKIHNIINLISQEFIQSRNIHHRKGGLIGLAALAIGFNNNNYLIERYLKTLIKLIINCFDDQESRVCYYACESLYNLSKVSKNYILNYFNEIFDGICKLFSHVDIDVKNGANLLDRLMKDIVTETESFDIESFIPILQKHIRRKKPYIRQLLVGWIVVLDAVPDINMLDYLPDFLEGLFDMLSDGNREIRQASENALSEFLKELKEVEVIEFGPMVTILIEQAKNRERNIRLTSLVWINEFILLGGMKLIAHYSGILSSIILCISDTDNDIRAAAILANASFMVLVKNTNKKIEFLSLIQILIFNLLSEHVTTRVASLHWLYMLHEKNDKEFNKYINEILPALLKAINDKSDEVVLINLQVLGRICLDEVQFHRVLSSIILLFYEERNLLETRGALVIRKLCSLLNSSDIFIALSKILITKNDLEFISLMVQTLNLILLTAPETENLRKILKNSFQSTDSNSTKSIENKPDDDSSKTLLYLNKKETVNNKKIFDTLFVCWTHNPVATFSLCLLAQAYEISSKLISLFTNIDITVGFLLQVDKLIQLIESPIFLHLRLQLLEVNNPSRVYLINSLYGLLMLLPQSQAYKILSDRLSVVSSLHIHYGLMTMQSQYKNKNQITSGTPEGIASETQKDAEDSNYLNDLLNHFEKVQLTHSEVRLSTLKGKSLLEIQEKKEVTLVPEEN